MHLIVTHTNPDLDAICAIWLLKRFHPHFSNAELRFVAAGETYRPTEIEKLKACPRENGEPAIVHVDTGSGEFDHHQTSSLDVCASTLVLDYLEKNNFVGSSHGRSLHRLVNVVLEIDHFKEIFWEDPANDRYDFFLEEILRSLKLIWRDQDERVATFGMDALEAVYQKMQSKVRAEEDIKNGKIVETRNGKIIAIETTNDEVVKLAQKKGFQIVIRKDPRKGYVRIKTIPNGKVDFSKAYEKFKTMDSAATWFLHSSKCMILNGSTKNPKMKPTRLGLTEIIEIVKENL